MNKETYRMDIGRIQRLAVARSELLLALTFIRSSSAETIADQPEYEMEYIGVQLTINKWIDKCDADIRREGEKLLKAGEE